MTDSAAAARALITLRGMIGHGHEIRPSPAPDGVLLRCAVEPRRLRVLEETAGGHGDCRREKHCPPAAPVLPSPGQIPFDRYLEQRNREDRVEFSLGRGERPCPKCPPRKTRPEPKPPQKDDPLPARSEAAARGPRLGEVSPVAPEAVQRRLETVYRVTVPVRGGRIDLLG